MNRTIKFQLANIKKTLVFSGLLAYGSLAMFVLLGILSGKDILSDIVSRPVWLTIISVFIVPLTIVGIAFPIFEGFIFFDSALRFGVSRTSYFMTQIVIYIFTTLWLNLADGLMNVGWKGSLATYLHEIAVSNFSYYELITEFNSILGIAILILAVYRFRAKLLIPLALLAAVFGTIFLSSMRMFEDSFIVDAIFHMIAAIIKNAELFFSMFTLFILRIYYLLVTTTEVQE